MAADPKTVLVRKDPGKEAGEGCLGMRSGIGEETTTGTATATSGGFGGGLDDGRHCSCLSDSVFRVVDDTQFDEEQVEEIPCGGPRVAPLTDMHDLHPVTVHREFEEESRFELVALGGLVECLDPRMESSLHRMVERIDQ